MAETKDETIREYGSLTRDGDIRVELRVKEHNSVDFVFVYKSNVASEAGASKMEFSTPVTLQALKILRDMLDDAEVLLKNQADNHDTA